MPQFIESLESRKFLSATIATVTAAPAQPTAAVLPAVTVSTVLGQTYKGSYKIAGTSKAVSFTLLKAYTGGLYAASVTDAGIQYDGNVVVSGSTITINWFTYDAAMAQVPVGTIQGTLSSDGVTILGTVTKGTLTGAAKLTKAPVPVADQDYTWVGSYTINGVTKKISVKLVKGYGNGLYYVNVRDGGTVFDGNLYTGTDGVMRINWFRYDAYYNQVPVGSITITGASANNNTMVGTVTKKVGAGTVTLMRPGIAPSVV